MGQVFWREGTGSRGKNSRDHGEWEGRGVGSSCCYDKRLTETMAMAEHHLGRGLLTAKLCVLAMQIMGGA